MKRLTKIRAAAGGLAAALLIGLIPAGGAAFADGGPKKPLSPTESARATLPKEGRESAFVLELEEDIRRAVASAKVGSIPTRP